ncbi:MAG: transporter family [Rhodospirillaceae bacterium]|nr:MAG: transporter family [Rhodospirillaceae bacterium]TNC97356.1 MAG: transporter family protein [Stygiobacter sp.]
MHGEAQAWVPQVLFGLNAMWVSTLVLVATYAVIMSEKLNRAIAALLGAGAMILLGVLNQEAAIRGVDFNTIALLIGMMVVVAVTRRSGVFQYVAIWAAKKVHANPAGILFTLQMVTALFSALLDNVTTVLLVVPVTLVITEELKLKPWPFLVALIFASNIGGTSTLIGDPPNILIGSATGLTFNQFVFNLAPVVVVIQLLTAGLFHLMWGRKLHAAAEDRARVMGFSEAEAITDVRLLKQSLGVLVLIIGSFIGAHFLGLEPGTIAMFGAALLLLLYCLDKNAEEQSHEVHHLFGEVEWVTIFFFVGLFIVVSGVEKAGVLGMLAEMLVSMTGGDLKVTAIAILWASAILSAVVDNIPFVATMIPLIKSMAPVFGGEQAIEPLWWALSLGACLGGNGTLVGASANLTVAGLAERAGHPIRFIPFMKVAFGLMLLSIVISNIYLVLRYL